MPFNNVSIIVLFCYPPWSNQFLQYALKGPKIYGSFRKMGFHCKSPVMCYLTLVLLQPSAKDHLTLLYSKSKLFFVSKSLFFFFLPVGVLMRGNISPPFCLFEI